ncbi:MAG: PEP-CTERM sorting domain-containing protein [Lentisphaeria bacterium]|nr:PEP-CTERM sorting domain-containing protein [Lentisphaeria bacterium]
MNLSTAKHSLFFLVAVLFAAITSTSTHAATISVDSSTFVDDGNTLAAWSASMNNSNAFLKDESGALVADLTGTVVDYEFIDGDYKGAASVVNEIAFNNAGTRGQLNLWTEAMDPSVDPAIVTGGDNGSPHGGSLNISTLSAGTAWIIMGYWASAIDVNATMTDTDGILGDVTMAQFTQPVRNGGSARAEHFVFEMNFADAGDYETITWTDTSSYFTGVVVTEIPPLVWGGGSGVWTDENWSGPLATDRNMVIDTAGSVVTVGAPFTSNSVTVGETQSSTLVVDSNLTVATGLTIGPEGILNGNGTITGALTVDGKVAPGSSIGEITVDAGPATFADGSTYDWEFASASSADLIDVNGTLVLPNGGTVNLNILPLGFPEIAATDTFGLFQYTTLEDSLGNPLAGNVAGYFTVLTPVNGSKFDLSGLTITATGTAIEIAGFTYIPEPSTAILAGLGLAGLTLRRRSRSA